MKKELIKKLFLKEVVAILLLIIITTSYLKMPFNEINSYELEAEIAENILIYISTYKDENIDYLKGFNNSFSVSLPFSQIIEYKKQKFIYNLALYNNDGKQIPKDFKNILVSTNLLNSLKELKLENSNSKYTLYQFLGVMTLLFIIIVFYFTIKFIKPKFLNYYIFIIVILYITNFIFWGYVSYEESLIEKTLKESYVTNKLN